MKRILLLIVMLCIHIGIYAQEDFASMKEEAEAGDAHSQANLGVLYATGNGVEQNMTEAIKWFRKSAEQGNEDAKEALDKLGVNY